MTDSNSSRSGVHRNKGDGWMRADALYFNPLTLAVIPIAWEWCTDNRSFGGKLVFSVLFLVAGIILYGACISLISVITGRDLLLHPQQNKARFYRLPQSWPLRLIVFGLLPISLAIVTGCAEWGRLANVPSAYQHAVLLKVFATSLDVAVVLGAYWAVICTLGIISRALGKHA